jgi:hypothetical protein
MPTDTDERFDIEGLSVSAFEVATADQPALESLTSGYGLTETGASANGHCSCCCSVSCLSCA